MKRQEHNFVELAKMDGLLEGAQMMSERKLKGEQLNGLGEFQKTIGQMNDIVSLVFMEICIAARSEMGVVQ